MAYRVNRQFFLENRKKIAGLYLYNIQEIGRICVLWQKIDLAWYLHLNSLRKEGHDEE